VALIVEIGVPELLPELVKSLSEHGCLTHSVGDGVCRIVHPQAFDAAEELYEVHFFVRAWQARNGVEATVSPDA